MPKGERRLIQVSFSTSYVAERRAGSVGRNKAVHPFVLRTNPEDTRGRSLKQSSRLRTLATVRKFAQSSRDMRANLHGSTAGIGGSVAYNMCFLQGANSADAIDADNADLETLLANIQMALLAKQKQLEDSYRLTQALEQRLKQVCKLHVVFIFSCGLQAESDDKTGAAEVSVTKDDKDGKSVFRRLDFIYFFAPVLSASSAFLPLYAFVAFFSHPRYFIGYKSRSNVPTKSQPF